MAKVRWGLLSTAHINRRLIPAIRASKQGELVAVASRGEERAKEYAKEWKIGKSFGSYEAMLESDEVDAVYIGLPNHLHAEWAVKALQAGKHVLCEKPFALSVEEVDRMFAASRENGKVLQEGFMYRHHPQTKKVAEMVKSGQLGDIHLMQASFSFFMTDTNRVGNVRLVPEYGGGALWDVGIYPISYTRLIFGGLPHAVSAQQWIGETGVDEVFVGQLHYSDGRTAQISCGFHIPYYTSVEIHGSKGRLSISRPFTQVDEKDAMVTFTPAMGDAEKVKIEKKELYLGEVENMNAAILEGQPTLVTEQESRDHIRLACALLEAAKTGKMVNL